MLKNCQEINNDSNDGDSFHVRTGGKEYVFRLYFVDAPETDASFPERVQEQANYFKLTTTQALQLGDYAKRFANEKLSRPFTVRTCMQDALGRSMGGRFYAFIETTEGDLAELLVANGMARVHGALATPVGLNSPQVEEQKLERLEREAKVAKVGGWGAQFGRMTARLAKQPPKTGADSFAAFFHPEQVAAPETPVTNLHASSAAKEVVPAPVAVAGTKLDPNTATSAELLAIPGLGPVLTTRIIAARPFKNPDDLRSVKGIGAKKYSLIRPFFLPAPAAAATAR